MLKIASKMTLMGVVLLLTNGCERKTPANETKDSPRPTVAVAEHGPDDGHDHSADIKVDDRADDHVGCDHGEAETDEHAGHSHGGEKHKLGSREIEGFSVTAAQFGVATDNLAELVFEIEVKGESAPNAVRLLVRAADGAESLKVRADKVGDHGYDAHVGELPDQLGEGGVLVVEVETPTGIEELTFPFKT